MARPAAQALTAAAAQAFPLEAAGFLLGVRRGRTLRASEIVLARGSAGGPGAFDIPDHDVRRIEAWAEDRRLAVLALFHSHPSGDSRLSAADRAALRHSPWPWVVVTQARGRGGIGLAAYWQGVAMSLPARVEEAAGV